MNGGNQDKMGYKDMQIRGLPVRGILTVLGSFLSLLFLGAFYTFGNVMPYFVSYMRNVTGEDITYRYDFGKCY